jgi:SOUL heme-binding protein
LNDGRRANSKRPVVLYSGKSGLEIRQYEPYRVCTYDMMGPNGSGGRSYNPATDAVTSEPAKGNVQAFGALAGYLFGKNQEKLAMKMTTPVFMNTNDDSSYDSSEKSNGTGTTKSMSFVLPSDYWGDNGDDGAAPPPQPLAESGVRIETVSTGTTRAVWPFGGYARNVAAQSDELRRQLRSVTTTTRWTVAPAATVQLAQYNDPFTPPWRRLNEVSIAVVQND